MQLVQMQLLSDDRRVGLVDGEEVIDLTSADSGCRTVFQLVRQAIRQESSLQSLVEGLANAAKGPHYSYSELLNTSPGSAAPFLLAPIDHPEPSRLHITGTGLTHLGSVKSRDEMHGGKQATEPQTDSARMFAMGIEGGRPAAGDRGTSPEWFYKGNGTILRGQRGELELPAYALDGGEEPEIVGCYLIDDQGQPRRIGFLLGNEWSDHATEKINYLYLAPSKLRTCAVGPSLQVTDKFDEVQLQCQVRRGSDVIYDSGLLYSGEQHMCHSLRNMEDHHFKYGQHRRPGDIHLHFFGTSRLSFSSRTWKYQDGDEITILAPGFCAPLTNSVIAGPTVEAEPVIVRPV